MKFIKKLVTGALTCILVSLNVSGSMCVNVNADVSAVYGDLNGDGSVNVMDAIYMKRYALEKSENFSITNWRKSIDVTGSGYFSGDDISVTKRGILNDFSEGEDEKLFFGKEISTFKGIDVSKWQEEIDWNKVKNAGVDFVMIKAGEGTKVEEKFFQNIKGAKEAGIQCGIYWFANARNLDECHIEAAICLETIKEYQLEYPVVYDFEYRTMENENPLKYNRELATEVIFSFLSDIEKAGYYAMAYSNKDFPQRYLYIERITDRFDFWYANYGISVPDTECGIFQYSCKGRIDGINTDVDLDISYKNYKSIMLKNNFNGF